MAQAQQEFDFSDLVAPAAKPKKAPVKRMKPKSAPVGDFDFSDLVHAPKNIFGTQFVTDDNKTEGRYLMRKAGEQDEDVPFSSVADAMGKGYDLSPIDATKYKSDLKKVSPPTGYFANVAAEAKAVPQGVSSLVAPLTSTGGRIAEAVAGPAGIAAVAGKRLIEGEVQSRSALADQSVGYGVEAVKNKDAEKGLRSAVSLLTSILPVPGIAAIGQKINDTVDRGDIAGGWGMLTVDVPLLLVGLKASGKITEPVKNLATKTIDKMVEKYRPEEINVGSTKVPMLQSEARPETKEGEYTEETKYRGTSARRFKRVQQEQQAKVKEVIRNIAQETGEFTGPMQFEPSAAMGDASHAVFEKAKPMYKALDDSLVAVPKDWSTASNVLRTAVARAQKLGADIPLDEEPVTVIIDHSGNIIDPQEVSKAKIDESMASGEWKEKEMMLAKTPLQDFQTVKSQLGDMARKADSAGEFNKARLIRQEMRSMDAEAEKALEGTNLYRNWKEADRLWAKGYALSEISDALEASTKGTPQGVITSPNISQVPTQIQGAGLVNRLNQLAEEGVLDRGLTREQVKNLRLAAYIIDRSQAVRVGTSTGESISRSRALPHLISGNPWLTTGATVGAAAGLLTGHFMTGLEMGSVLGFIADSVSRRALAVAMTTTDGVRALRDLSFAKTPTAKTIAVRRLMVAARSATKKVPVTNNQQDNKKPKVLEGDTAPTHIFNESTGQIEPIQ